MKEELGACCDLEELQRIEQQEADDRMKFMVYGFIGMAVSGLVILGVVNAVRLLGR